MDYLVLLPHTPPMRLLDDVIDLVPGVSCRARRTTCADDFYFQGHFPGNPIVPAVILVELIAQAGGLAAALSPELTAEQPVQLRVAGLGPCKFPAAAGAGVTLEAAATVAGRLGALYRIHGTVTADGRLVASGSVTLALASR